MLYKLKENRKKLQIKMHLLSLLYLSIYFSLLLLFKKKGRRNERDTDYKGRSKTIFIQNEICMVGVPIVAQHVRNLTSIHEDAGSIPGLA